MAHKAPLPCPVKSPFRVPRVLSALLCLAAPAGLAQKPTAVPNLNDPSSFPPEAYAGFGSSLGQSSHFGELGWSDEQVGAFMHGMDLAFHGKAPPMDDESHRLSAEFRQVTDSLDQGHPAKFQGAYSPAAYAAFGASLEEGGHFEELGWDDSRFGYMLEGMRSVFRNKPFEVGESSRQLSTAMGRRLAKMDSSVEKPPAEFDPSQLVPFMRKAAKAYHLQMSDTGLGYNISQGRNGIRPRLSDTVVISVHAQSFDGTPLPQLSAENARTRVDVTLPGFREALQMMTVGSQGIIVLPPALSFGEGQWPQGVQPGSPLVFQIILKDVAPAGK